MGNMASVIRRHNAKVQQESIDEPQDKSCNCRNKSSCPLDGECLVDNAIYKATVTAAGHANKEYIGMTEHAFKTRYNNHQQSFKYKKYSTATALSKYVWQLKESQADYSIK